MIDTTGRNESTLGFRKPLAEYMRIDEAVLLIECLMQGAVEVDVTQRPSREELDMLVFCSFIRPTHRLARTSLCRISRIRALHFGGRRLPQSSILHLQYHLVYLQNVDNFHCVDERFWPSPAKDMPRVIYERHPAKIRQLSHSRTSRPSSTEQTSRQNSNYELSETRFDECRLSMSLHLYGKGGEFQLVLVGDEGAYVDLTPSLPFEERHVNSSLRLDPNSLNHLAGLTHFLVNVVHLMDTWYEGWKQTLDKIDDIVGFEVAMIHDTSSFQVLWKANIV